MNVVRRRLQRFSSQAEKKKNSDLLDSCKIFIPALDIRVQNH
jgi:hypothetical protein